MMTASGGLLLCLCILAASTANAMTVCVTGASGYVASVLVAQLVDEGFKVVGTVRDVAKYAAEPLFHQSDDIQLFPSDLLDSASFDAPFRLCGAVMHTASPFWTASDDPVARFIEPAVNGTRNVMEAARRAGVRKVVVTSSTAAVTWQRAKDQGPDRVWTEADWNMDSTLTEGPYRLSKRMAEKEAWRLAEAYDMSLAVINPAFVLGPPVLARASGVSVGFGRKLFSGAFAESGAPGGAKAFGVVDVRDLATAHIRALERMEFGSHPGGPALRARGSRFVLASTLAQSPLDLADAVRKSKDPALAAYAARMPTAFAPPDEDLSPGDVFKLRYSSDHAASILDVRLRPVEETLRDMATALADLGLVERPGGGAGGGADGEL